MQSSADAHQTTKPPGDRYVPAAGRRGLTGSYDAAMALTMREEHWRPQLRDRVLSLVAPDGHVVDVGAGTGTLAIAMAGARPDVAVTAIDGDAEVLARAQVKTGAGSVRWRLGLADDLKLATACADAVVMSLVLHHLGPDAKRRALIEAVRVLRPGGRLYIVDWGQPATALLRVSFFVLQLLDGFDGTRDHAAGRLPEFIRGAGFADIQRRGRLRTVWGTVELLESRLLA